MPKKNLKKYKDRKNNSKKVKTNEKLLNPLSLKTQELAYFLLVEWLNMRPVSRYKKPKPIKPKKKEKQKAKKTVVMKNLNYNFSRF